MTGGGAFLQTEAGAVLKRLVMSFPQLSELDRQSVTAFLTGSSAAPGTSEIVGILKEMKDEMDRDLGGLNSAEEQAQKQFEELAAAKKKEIAAATKAIEEKTQRSGELAVKIVQGKDDLEDTQSAMAEDEQFKANLARDCETKKKEFNDRVKLRAEELQALAETIKVLNDDDVLDLFKKAIPTPGESFLQEDSTMKTVVKQATDALRAVKKTFNNPQIDFISLALKGKKVDFSKVLKLIDDLVATLGEEQKNDDEHKDYCNAEFDTSDDKKKAVQRNITAQQHAQEEAETQSKNLAAEIKALQEGIAALDKSVAEATEQRKKENAEFVQTSAENNAALKLLDFAKNRLNKFYNPKLYKPPPERQLSEEERIYSNMGGELEPTPAPGGIAGTGVAVFLQTKKAAPAAPPETWGAYEKKGSQSTGVIAMIDMLANDLKKDTQEAEMEEKDSQEEYEELMADSKKKRAADSKSITTKETAKAEADEAAETAKENLASGNAELKATNDYIQNLHGECDFLVENYDFRKEARAEEVDSLKKAKAVLSGADYSFLQVSESPCIQICRSTGQYPNCQCPNFSYDATPNRMTWDELYEKFDQLKESGRNALKAASANVN